MHATPPNVLYLWYLGNPAAPALVGELSLVLGRRGVEAKGAPTPLLPEVSSSEIRAAIQGGEVERVREVLPREVLAYIEQKGLYR